MSNAEALKLEVIERRVRFICAFFLLGFILSGLTAIPIRAETAFFAKLIGEDTFMEGEEGERRGRRRERGRP